MQKLLKALEPREVDDVEMSPEDLAEAERRWVVLGPPRCQGAASFENAVKWTNISQVSGTKQVTLLSFWGATCAYRQC